MSETCGRCGRRLKNPAYIEIGYGRVCAAKLGIAVPSKDKPHAPKKPDKAEGGAGS